MSSGCRDKHCNLPPTPSHPSLTPTPPKSDNQGEQEGGRGLEQRAFKHPLRPSSGRVLILGPAATPSPPALRPAAQSSTAEAESDPLALIPALALKINYSVEVRGGKTKADPSASEEGGQCRSAAGKRCDSVIYHRGDHHHVNTRSGCH